MTSHTVTFAAGVVCGGWLLHHIHGWRDRILTYFDAAVIGDPDGAR